MKAIILAAGKGTRMKSKHSKVMHQVAGLPMISHVLDAVNGAGINDCFVVIGYGGEEIRQYLGDRVKYVVQTEQLGTGHAVMQAEPFCRDDREPVLVLAGDTPLLTSEIIEQLVDAHRLEAASATVLTTKIDNPTGYGRIVREGEGKIRIVEEKDASPGQRAIKEVNTGSYCFNSLDLFWALKNLTPQNAQGEYYLTDVLEILQNEGKSVAVSYTPDFEAVQGINDRLQLAEAEKVFQKRVCHRLMESGVTIIDPATTFIGKNVKIGRDTVVYPFTLIEGKTEIGEDGVIGPRSRIVDSVVGNRVVIDSSVVLDSCLADDVTVGPFSYLRPETRLQAGVKIGDFVEIKKSVIGEGSKVPHLSYLGDSTVGKNVNIGAGTITCNYDGINKHPTIIGDQVFIGSNTNLVAPITVGSGAKTGAGSTLTKDIPEGVLAVEREKQRHIPLAGKKQKE